MNGPGDRDSAARQTREARLDALREEAARTGSVAESGVRAAGGPLPPIGRDDGGGRRADGEAPGYYGRPVVKPPVWTWEVPLYFFVGGLAGMAAVIALAAAFADPDAALEATGSRGALLRAALHVALGGALVSALLLTLDLGRPARFLNMLRVFKWRSPMSVGAWVLTAFGGLVTAAALLLEILHRAAPGTGGTAALEVLVLLAILAAGLLGAILATYTGVLVGATAIPAWFTHHRGLPVHFGVAGLGSAAALLELLGFRLDALNALGLFAAGVETLFGAWVELRRNGAADRALRGGRAALLLRTAGLLAGPTALGLRLLGWVPGAAVAFLAGALVSRYGWLAAGRVSAADPEATFAAQRRGG